MRGLVRRVRGSVRLVEVVMGGGLGTLSTLAPSELAWAPSEMGTSATLSTGSSLRAKRRNAFVILLNNFFGLLSYALDVLDEFVIYFRGMFIM